MLHFIFIFLCWFLPAQAASPSWVTTPKNQRSVFVPSHPAPNQNWQQISSIYADIFYTHKDRQVAVALSRHAATSIPHIARQLGLGSGSSMQIYITPTQKMFLQLQPDAPPDWADGTAWPKEGLIFLRSPDFRDGRSDPLTQVLDHEISHVLLGRAFAHRPVPRWLQEGVAQLMEGTHQHRSLEKISEGLLGNSLLSLRELSRGFPAHQSRAQLAYAQSVDFVTFLLRNYGRHSIPLLIDEMARGSDFDQAIFVTTGRTVDELDTLWQGKHRESFLWLQTVVNDTTIMAVGGFLLVFGFVRAYIRRRKQVLHWDGEQDIQDALEMELQNWYPTYGIPEPTPTFTVWDIPAEPQ